ncbi:hypothetical protein D3C80_214300 [compost metagenome]
MLQTFDTNLAILGVNSFWRTIIECNEARIIDTAFHQLFRELRTDPRGGIVIINGVVDDAEAFAGFQIFIGSTNRCGVNEIKARFIGLQGRARCIALFQCLRHDGKRFRALFPGA